MANLDQDAIMAAFSQPDYNGRFSGPFAEYIQQLARRRPAVIFAFPPKAAGTFLRTASIAAIDGQLIRVVHAQGGRDAQPYVPVLLLYYLGQFGDRPMVAHMHMQALAGNRGIVDAFGWRPIMMVRSIPDMLASYWDMVDVDDDALADGLNCRFPPEFRSLERTRQGDFLVDIVAPWYAGYYATWVEYAAQDPAKILTLDFDEFTRAPDAALERALEHAGIARSREICRSAIEETWRERRNWRFNDGRPGRGAEYFEPRQLQRIRDLLRHYRPLDDLAERLTS